MKSYPFEVSLDGLKYYFDSVGPRGVIPKIVRFRSTTEEECFHLAFGDSIEESDQMDDSVVSNNGDTERILNTVKEIIFDFLTADFQRSVFFSGAISTRNRLYRMFVSRYFDELRNRVEIYGVHNGAWEIFRKHRPFDAFLISRNGNFNFKFQ